MPISSMLTALFAAVFVYLATSVDEIPFLFAMFAHRKRYKAWEVAGGYLVGTLLLAGISLLTATVLNFLPRREYLGLLGLIPLMLGIRAALTGEEEEEPEIPAEKKFRWAVIEVIALTLALGGDDLAVYIPLFTASTAADRWFMIAVFTISTGILLYVSKQLTAIHAVSEFIEKYERVLVAVIFIGLAVYIFIQCGTVGLISGMK